VISGIFFAADWDDDLEKRKKKNNLGWGLFGTGLIPILIYSGWYLWFTNKQDNAVDAVDAKDGEDGENA
jgi:hypothetical protein